MNPLSKGMKAQTQITELKSKIRSASLEFVLLKQMSERKTMNPEQKERTDLRMKALYSAIEVAESAIKGAQSELFVFN